MIKRTIILFFVILSAFYIAGKYGYLPYKSTGNGYFEKSERYAYSDSVRANDIVIAGTSLSATYSLDSALAYTCTNMSMTGRNAIDGIAVMMSSNKLPEVVLVEVNLFDNTVDSATLQKVFYPVMKDVKKAAFFTQREYKLHNLLPAGLYNANRQVMGLLANYSGMYSDRENSKIKAEGSANTEIKEDYIRNKNITYHAALNDTSEIFNRYLLLQKQVSYLQKNGVQVVFFETPVISNIYNSKRTAYKQSLVQRLSQQFDIPCIKAADNNAYQQYLVHGDGIHMAPQGIVVFQAYLNAAIPPLLNKQ